ncbi:hypothetical protein Tco_0563686 [Tanacetum coccineum]
MDGYTLRQLRGEVDRAVSELAARSSKRYAEEELDQESSKRQKTDESSELAEEPRDKKANERSQEELQQMMIIVPEQGMNVEALQTKDDLVMLWSLVKEKFNSTEPTNDKEREIWVELKRLFEPDTDDELWKLQKHIHDLTWRLYDSSKLLVDQDNEMSRELLRKIFMQVNHKFKGGLLGLKVFILSTAKPRVSTAQVTTASTNQLVLLEATLGGGDISDVK